jgi:uncharacterized protein YndB with AHSA1/START domain
MAAAQHEVVINAPPSRVWSLLGDVRTWESWNPKVKGGRMLEGDEFQYTCDGKPSVGTITQVERLKTLAWRSGNCRQSFRLEADGDKTRVISSAEIGGFMASLRKSKSEQEAADLCQGWLAGLKQGAEKANS